MPVRVEQEVLDVCCQPLPQARANQLTLELVVAPAGSRVRAGQLVAEVLVTPVRVARINQLVAEVLVKRS